MCNCYTFDVRVAKSSAVTFSETKYLTLSFRLSAAVMSHNALLRSQRARQPSGGQRCDRPLLQPVSGSTPSLQSKHGALFPQILCLNNGGWLNWAG